MDDLHISRELLWAVSRGELPASVIAQIAAQHLMSLCRTCRQEITRFQEERRAAAAAGSSRALELLPEVLDERTPLIEGELKEAARDLEILLALPPEERIQRIERARSRFRSATLVRLLIEESRKRVQNDPEEAFHLASLARLVAIRNPRMPRSFDLIAMATAHIANACRIQDDRRQAEEHFGHVRYVITYHGVTDPEVLARVDHLEGSLRMDQRQFQKAEELLGRAAMLYRVSGIKVETARVLITLGLMYFYRGDITPAIKTTTAALEEFRPGDDPRLYLCARYNLARYLTEDGQYKEAAEMLSLDEGLYREFPEAWTQLRLAWLRGKIAAGLGRSEEAERIFLQVRDGFIAQGIGYDAAMVSIEDLALLYVREGRVADVKRLAEEIFPIFQAQDVHREAVAALMLFQDAARQEQLTVKAVREYARYLQEARTDPSLRFRQERPA
jgi:tetratricopeptide (TPR) repeat protein